MATEPEPFQSRAVSSWFFGDGAALLNEVIDRFRAVSNIDFERLVPLDDMLTSRAATRTTASAFGVRVGRRLSSRYGLEIGVDWSRTALDFTAAAREAIDVSGFSFDQAFTDIFEVAPVADLSVTSRANYSDATTSQLAVTAAINIALGRIGAFAPYAVAGGGVRRTSGDAAQVVIRGTYQFRLFNSFPFNESDAVTVRLVDRETTPIGVIGGGVALELSARHALTFDVRAQLGSNRTRTTVSASPSIAPGSPGFVLPSNTNPGIQFSTTSGIRSSLGDALPEMTTFSGSGLEARVLVSAGYSFRF
jgi:hypothetical protein